MKILINGCFDCFHDGHKQLFDYAIEILNLANDINSNNKLIVLLNSDSSYLSLRGKLPKDNDLIRFRNVINYIEWLTEKVYRNDYVNLCFDVNRFDTEEELLDLINYYKPTFILKGHDYSDLTKVVGFPHWPILIKPRGTDREGKDISSTELKGDKNV